MRPRLQIRRLGALWGAQAFLMLLVMLVAPASMNAQPRPTRPGPTSLYAIQGARVVTVSDQTINNGTVVVQGGIITAVGENVSVPAGAWVIDGSTPTDPQ